jgi:hypothetical protein
MVLKCSVGDYKNSSGSQSISKDVSGNRTFKKYDLILPYITKNGQKVPYSSYENGRAKIFQVVGIKYQHIGTLWQYLYLEEYNNI